MVIDNRIGHLQLDFEFQGRWLTSPYRSGSSPLERVGGEGGIKKIRQGSRGCSSPEGVKEQSPGGGSQGLCPPAADDVAQFQGLFLEFPGRYLQLLMA